MRETLRLPANAPVKSDVRLRLLTFATSDFQRHAEALAQSALSVGFESARIATPDDVRASDFYTAHQAILDEPRGAGYWLWKPFLIRQEIAACSPNDVVLYADAGRNSYYRFASRPDALVAYMRFREQGCLLGVSVPQVGPLKRWTKRDCLVLMEADRPEIVEKPLVQATWSLWSSTPQALAFLDEWIAAAIDARCLTDAPNVMGAPNYPDFVDHRHDQSIMSILAHKMGAPFIDPSATLTHRLLALRPSSAIAHYFYKRPENLDRLLRRDDPLCVLSEHFALRRCLRQA
jgi:hypothetical protein